MQKTAQYELILKPCTISFRFTHRSLSAPQAGGALGHRVRLSHIVNGVSHELDRFRGF